jgi:hypothetical protein
MDLTSVLLRAAAQRPHVLVVPAPGGAAVRLAVEAALVRRGWPSATGPADADVVVVAGSAGPELGAIIERTWRLVPAPRARALVAEAAQADRELDRAVTVLADRRLQRSRVPGGTDDEIRHPGHGVPDGRQRNGDQGHAGNHGHHGPDGHQGHGGHHGHGGGMEMPGGLPMADLGEDRDGLTLDQLHVALGPVLPDWPAGLVVRVTLQGDVVQDAAAEVLDAGAGARSPWWTGRGAERELDGLARFLGVVGWADAAAQARRLRDTLLAGSAPDGVAVPAAALVNRVRRSRTLRWLVREVPAGPIGVAGLLDERLAAVESAVGSPHAAPATRLSVDEMAGLLVGAELAAARMIVAAVDPDTDHVAVPHGEVRHG